MPRPQKSRKLYSPPKMQGFKPFGLLLCDTEHIVLNFDEYEALKLLKYDGLMQEEAAKLMGISRPSITRIYNRALTKIAQAFVEGKSVFIGGGNVEFDKDWFKCKKCFKLIEGLENHTKCAGCNIYSNSELINLNSLKKV